MSNSHHQHEKHPVAESSGIVKRSLWRRLWREPVNAITAIATLVLATGTVILALATVQLTRATQLMAQQAELDARPQLRVTIAHKRSLYEFIIKNSGHSAANRVNSWCLELTHDMAIPTLSLPTAMPARYHIDIPSGEVAYVAATRCECCVPNGDLAYVYVSYQTDNGTKLSTDSAFQWDSGIKKWSSVSLPDDSLNFLRAQGKERTN